MQGDELATQEVLPRRNALRDRDSLHALVGDEAVDAPFATAIETVFGDLEPTSCVLLALRRISHHENWRWWGWWSRTSNSLIRLRVGHFLQVRHHRALVTRIDHIAAARGQRVAPSELCG